MRFLYCVIYLAILCVTSFLVGRLLPKRWFHSDRPPFRSFRFEREGRIYNRLHIKKWQNLVPDMSRLFPWLMPAKRVGEDLAQQLPRMLQETCIAEATHLTLAWMGFGVLAIWHSIVAGIIGLLYCLGNLPYVLIQRFNRPRLQRIYDNLRRTNAAV